MSAPRVRAIVGSARLVEPAPLPGDALAERIARDLLGPAARAFPSTAAVIAEAERCGGCTHAKHTLGSSEPHPDPGSVI